jgi:homoserine kinase type II
MSSMPASDPLNDSSAGSLAALRARAEGDASSEFDRFEVGEAVVVLSHYDLGVVSAAQEFRRGSRRSPKLLVKCDRGLLILKRLAPGRDEPGRLEFAHEVQRILASAGYPLPALIATRGSDARTLLDVGGRRYEVFECVSGQPYDQSPEATLEAGAMLGRFHAVLEASPPTRAAPTGSYHRLAAVPANLAFIPHRLGDERLIPVCESLREAYERAAEQADAAGLPEWPQQVIHGDWHPGNLLFRGAKVAAVIDYDTARLQPRAVDIANGALQFSLTRTADDPSAWPDAPDESRLKRFCQGYDSGGSHLISRSELAGLPWLMAEAMIAESATPIAVTGRFGRLEAEPILRMVERKVRWLVSEHARVTRLLS